MWPAERAVTVGASDPLHSANLKGSAVCVCVCVYVCMHVCVYVRARMRVRVRA